MTDSPRTASQPLLRHAVSTGLAWPADAPKLVSTTEWVPREWAEQLERENSELFRALQASDSERAEMRASMETMQTTITNAVRHRDLALKQVAQLDPDAPRSWLKTSEEAALEIFPELAPKPTARFQCRISRSQMRVDCVWTDGDGGLLAWSETAVTREALERPHTLLTLIREARRGLRGRHAPLLARYGR
jgi:hypothetical protein